MSAGGGRTDRRGASVTFEVADLDGYVPTPGGYDLVLIAYLQVPDDQLTPILRRAAAAVAPGGTFLLVCHDRDNLEHGYGGPKHIEVLTAPDQVVEAIGDEIFGTWLLPFEITALLLIIAATGSVALAFFRSEEREEGP